MCIGKIGASVSHVIIVGRGLYSNQYFNDRTVATIPVEYCPIWHLTSAGFSSSYLYELGRLL